MPKNRARLWRKYRRNELFCALVRAYRGFMFMPIRDKHGKFDPKERRHDADVKRYKTFTLADIEGCVGILNEHSTARGFISAMKRFGKKMDALDPSGAWRKEILPADEEPKP